jgi:hypothetical protein
VVTMMEPWVVVMVCGWVGLMPRPHLSSIRRSAGFCGCAAMRDAPIPHGAHRCRKKEGYLTFYHYNRWHLSDYHFNGAKYIFTIDVVKAIHFYHFCSRGTPAQLNSSDLS